MENAPSRHHVWSEHRNFRDNLGRRLRNERGFVIPTNVLWHRELHANVPHPPKPNPPQIHAIMAELESVEHTGKFDVLNYTIDAFLFFDGLENGLQDKALDIAANLQLQLDYLQHQVHA